MAGGTSFDATASMVGYLYQCRYALYKAVEAARDRPKTEISIERFDDVAFEDGGEPIELIQTKHHLDGKGSLTDSSADLWKTLRVWSERVKADSEAVLSSQFFLITTSTAPDESAASMLRISDRDEKEALQILTSIAATSKSQDNKAAYVAFFELIPELQLKLLQAVTVLDCGPTIIDLSDEIESELHHAVETKHVPALVERLEGWWFKRVIESLSTDGSPPIPVVSVEAKIDELREGFQRDALPVDFAELDVTQAILDEHDGRAFVRQLRQIEITPRRIEWAIRDYYRAFEQRSKWARDELLIDGEIRNYERGLIEAWGPRFEMACEDFVGGTPADKIKAGKKVFAWAENDADFPLRTIRQRFLTHGSFHILANRHVVGWHPDFDPEAGDAE